MKSRAPLHSHPNRRTIVSALAIALIAGCNGGGAPPSGSVSGKVTIDGKPLTGGSIRFHATSPDAKVKASGGVITADGSYIVPDAPIGPCKVTVDTGVRSGEKSKVAPAGPSADVMKKMQGPPAGMPAMGGGAGPGFASGEKAMPIEAAYSSVSTTPLSADVKRGANAANFEVK